MIFWPFRKSTEVWMSGFEEGYKKAWETMMPYIQETASNARKLSREMTIDELLKNNPSLKKK